MLARSLILCAVTMLTNAPPSAAQTAQLVPIPNGYKATDITPDGRVFVGYGSGGAFYWAWQTDPAPTFIGGSFASAVSDDGNVIVGIIDDPATGDDVAARWTAATGWVSLGYLPNALSCPSKSNARDVSGDGSVVVGSSWEGCDARAIRWTAATGMVALNTIGPGTSSTARVISGNGAVIGGQAEGAPNQKHPAVWDPSGSGAMVDTSAYGMIKGASETGQIVVGTFDSRAFYRVGNQPLVTIDTLYAGWSGEATDVSTDGRVICGYDALGLGEEAWVWTPEDGAVSIQQRLTALGVAGVPALSRCEAMTPDGSVLVGYTNFGGAWIAVLPQASAELYGCGLNPSGSMVISGSPVVGGAVTLGVDNPLGTQATGSSTLMFISLAPDTSSACGTLVFGASMTAGVPGELSISLLPGVLVTVLGGPPWAGPGNPSSFTLPIPPGLQSIIGVNLYCQGAIIDGSPGGLQGLTQAAELKIGLF